MSLWGLFFISDAINDIMEPSSIRKAQWGAKGFENQRPLSGRFFSSVISIQREAQQNAILDFFGKERTKLIRFILRKFHDISEMDAEDVLQDLLLNLFDKADPTVHVENLTAYIYRSLSNRVIDWLRKNRRRAQWDEFDEGLDGKVALEDGERPFDLSVLAEREEVRERIIEALDALEPRQRAVWIATEMEGYSFKELSEIWDEPMGTLLSRKHRAMKALQASLQDLQDLNK